MIHCQTPTAEENSTIFRNNRDIEIPGTTCYIFDVNLTREGGARPIHPWPMGWRADGSGGVLASPSETLVNSTSSMAPFPAPHIMGMSAT